MKRFPLWVILLAILLSQIFSGGCAPKRWSPTDPRSLEPDTTRITIDDSWTIGLGTTVNASACP